MYIDSQRQGFDILRGCSKKRKVEQSNRETRGRIFTARCEKSRAGQARIGILHDERMARGHQGKGRGNEGIRKSPYLIEGRKGIKVRRDKRNKETHRAISFKGKKRDERDLKGTMSR